MRRAARLAGLLLVVGLPACTMAPLMPEAPVAFTCTDEASRQFDFWIGEWNVIQEGTDAPPAVNRITPTLRGCALHEDYHSASGYRGESLNWYEADWGQWRQTWADSNGLILHLAGGLNAAGEMVLYGGDRQTREGGTVRDRITWSPQAGGTVRQVWHLSSDGGRSWRQIFSGLYVPLGDEPMEKPSDIGKRLKP